VNNIVKFRPKSDDKPDEALAIYLMAGDRLMAVITPEGDLIAHSSINEIYHSASQAGKFAGLFRMVAQLSSKIEQLESIIEGMKSDSSRRS